MSPSYGGQFEQMEIANIEHAFLTHIHSDHSGGLADLSNVFNITMRSISNYLRYLKDIASQLIYYR